MTNNDKTPIYNLKAVVQETGLKADTLRAWERRYGVPTPQRTESGHRLYSQYDIDILKWLIERQEDGMSISRAIELLHRLEEEGKNPLDAASAPGAPRNDGRSYEMRTLSSLPEAPRLGETGTVAQMRDAWVKACLNFEESQAEQLLAQAFALFPAEVVCMDLIQRGLHEIGAGWYTGRVTVQQEHFASALAIRRMEALLASTPAPTRAGRILVSCPPEEEHTFVPLLISLLLRRRGWDVVYLGANVPLLNLEATLTSVRPNLVVLTAQQLHTAAGLMEMAEVLFQARIPTAFGGLIFTEAPGLHEAIPGYYLGDKLEHVVGEIEHIMTNLRPVPAQRQVSYDYKEALDHFRSRQAMIEAEIWRLMPEAIPQRLLALANLNFGRAIIAALTLGRMDYLNPDLDWVEGLLVNHHQMPADALDDYLSAYYEAALRHLDRRGYVVIEWFARLLGRSLPTEYQPRAENTLSARRQA
ncbi:MAG TPA: MerR family transcriptional regulator [Chloroflexi bacterium]|nr:MerR family transcriptional regulator [Chloroflexota bacterium]